MNPQQRALCQAIRPVSLQEYLRSRGWLLKDDLSARGVVVYERDGVVVDVPLKPEYADYPRRVAEVLDPVAQLEGTSVATLVDDLLQPVGDVLAVRVCSDVTAAGTLPLEDAIRIRQGTKALLLAAAHSAVSAQAFFPRMSRTNAVALVSSVQEGQSHHGSVIARFIVPVEPAVGQMSYLEDPYGRKVMRLLLQALEAVRRVRSLGDYDPLLAMAKEGVRANLLSALASMAPPGKSGAVELSVDWARNRARPGGALSSVRFVSEALAGLDAVAEAMKGQTTTAGFEVEGYVTRLARAPGEANAPGEIIVVPTAGDSVDFARVSAELDAASYEKAILAHKNGDAVRVVGTLAKIGRRWMLREASGFAAITAGAVDGEGGI
jgi:hypothetical protein